MAGVYRSAPRDVGRASLAATDCYRLLSGVPVHVVAARLGHADPAITLRVYALVIRTAEAAAADISPRPSRPHNPADNA
jgi:integrase